jgi:hypothetical protein
MKVSSSEDLRKLIGILKETRTLIARAGNYFLWSSWADQDRALSEIDSMLTELENGSIPDIGVLFAPTGPFQEVSLSSGWGNDFLELANRFDKEYARVRNRS